MDKLIEKLDDLEANLLKQKDWIPECEKGVSLRLKCIEGLEQSIESVVELIKQEKKLPIL